MTAVGWKFNCIKDPRFAVSVGLKVKAPSFWSTDVLVARVPLPTPTDTNAVAAVLINTSEYQTSPATCDNSVSVFVNT